MLKLELHFRFYFPEYRVASNKVLVVQADSPNKYWKSVDNLNTCSLGENVFKFGFDSSRGLPYIQFPEDVSSLIGTGLQIQFIRTKGVSGNIAVSTLKTLEKPLSWSQTATNDEVDSELLVEGTSDTEDWKDVTLYTVTNLSAARDGKDPETIDEAYWNFQKTVGTFDTLVTCRDYMNKIYNLTVSDTSAAALISNIIVSDIRDDINRAYTLSTLTAQGTANKYRAHKDSDTGEDKIHYFDLMLYPFVAVNGLNSKTE